MKILTIQAMEMNIPMKAIVTITGTSLLFVLAAFEGTCVRGGEGGWLPARKFTVKKNHVDNFFWVYLSRAHFSSKDGSPYLKLVISFIRPIKSNTIITESHIGSAVS